MLPLAIPSSSGLCQSAREPRSELEPLTCSLRVRGSIAKGTAPRRHLSFHCAFDNITLRGPSSVKEARNLSGEKLEAAPIGWQLFVLESGKSDSIVFLLLLATYATRLLAQALSRWSPECVE